MTMVSHLKFFFTVGKDTEVIDPRLPRNERDRAGHASMPSNKREEINRKRRESYERKKEEPNNSGTTYILLNINIQCICHG